TAGFPSQTQRTTLMPDWASKVSPDSPRTASVLPRPDTERRRTLASGCFFMALTYRSKRKRERGINRRIKGFGRVPGSAHQGDGSDAGRDPRARRSLVPARGLL